MIITNPLNQSFIEKYSSRESYRNNLSQCFGILGQVFERKLHMAVAISFVTQTKVSILVFVIIKFAKVRIVGPHTML